VRNAEKVNRIYDLGIEDGAREFYEKMSKFSKRQSVGATTLAAGSIVSPVLLAIALHERVRCSRQEKG